MSETQNDTLRLDKAVLKSLREINKQAEWEREYRGLESDEGLHGEILLRYMRENFWATKVNEVLKQIHDEGTASMLEPPYTIKGAHKRAIQRHIDRIEAQFPPLKKEIER